MNPTNPSDAPDTARSYERAQPDKEAGMGRLDTNPATPAQAPDQSKEAVGNAQRPDRQINAEEVINDRAKTPLAPGEKVAPAPQQPDHSMFEEEPDGWDLAPIDIHDPRRKRHPRTDGKGGVP